MLGSESITLMRTTLLFSLFWFSAVDAAPRVARFDILTPRAFAYVIGDTLEHHIWLEVNEPYRLLRDSLPEAGKIDSWLELREPQLHIEKGRRSSVYHLTLTYQLFNIGKELKEYATPQHSITVGDNEHSLPLIVPEWRFTAAPITRAGDGDALQLQPPQSPLPMPLTPHVQVLAALLIVLCASTIYIVYCHWTLPFVARHNRPFAKTYRRLKNLARSDGDGSGSRDALACVHDAFNQTAGKAVFLENLDEFFAQNAGFEALRSPIELFFAESRKAFFTRDLPNREHCSVRWLISFCQDCRAIEREIT